MLFVQADQNDLAARWLVCQGQEGGGIVYTELLITFPHHFSLMAQMKDDAHSNQELRFPITWKGKQLVTYESL